MNGFVYVPDAELARLRALAVAPEARAAIFAAACRINVLYMVTQAGSGHLGTSFSCLDIVSWLFLEELRPRDPDGPVYFSSKGHDAPALYAVLIGLGLIEFELLHRLRRLGGLPGHPDVSVPFVAANTGSLGMGISKAKGMILADRLRGRRRTVYVLTGDGELQEGQLWEALQPAANLRLDELVVVVDHNKVQSDTLVERVSDLGDLEDKFATFGWSARRCDGHDLGAVRDALRELAAAAGGRPKVVIADTVKGKGVTFMEHTAMAPGDRLYPFHSGAPDAVTYERASAELVEGLQRMLAAVDASPIRVETAPFPMRAASAGAQHLVAAYGQALVEHAERDPRIVALDADLALDCGLLPFEQRLPERFIECGIAEQDMVSTAGGLALRGLLPVVHSFACFLSSRPNEQIYNNATERTKIVYVGSLAGVLPGGPGHSHQSVRDISALAAVPGLVLLQPCDEREVWLAVEYCLAGTRESCYLRLASIPCAVPYSLPHDYRLDEGRGVVLHEGDDAVLFGYGPVLLSEAHRACRELARRGLGVRLVNLPWLNRVDREWLREAVGSRRCVVTLDDHYVLGGQGQLLLSEVARLGLEPAPRTAQLGVREIPVCGANDEVLRAHRLDAASIAEEIERALRT